MKSLKTLLPILVILIATAAAAEELGEGTYDFVLAKNAASEGRYDEALDRIDRVIDRNSGNPVLLYERAMIYIDSGRLDRAESELRRLVAANPDFYDAHRVLGRLLLDRAGTDRSRVEEAMQYLHTAFRLNPDDLATGSTVAQILVSTGRNADAEKVLAALIERAPDQRGLNYNYAQVLTKLGRGNESKQYLERVVQLDPTFGPAILQLVDIYQKEGDWGRAADLLEPLVAEDPLNLDLRRQQAYFYLRGGKPEKARAAFSALVEADPKDTRALFYLGETLTELNQFDEADRIYRSLLEKTPNDPDLLASYALSQIAQRHYDDATKTFQALLAIDRIPDNLQVLAKTQLALIALQNGDLDAAIAQSREVLVFRDRPNGQAVSIALDAYKKQKRYREGVELLQPLVDQYAGDPFVNARYIEMLVRVGDKHRAEQAARTQAKFGTRNTIAAAEAYIQAGEHETAVAILNDALKNKPDEVDLHFELGSAYERGSRKGEAERVFLSILEKDPDHAATLNYLGYMWAESGTNLERAAEMLNRAVSQEPRNGAYVDSLGWVYFQQGKLDLAEKYLTDATRLLPRDATVHEHLGDVFARRGDYTRALSLYRVALSMDPDPKDEAKLRSKIEQAEKQTTTR
jgi:tetratricopeptide (TPR) repeat protein